MAKIEKDFSEYKPTENEKYYAKRSNNKYIFYDYFDNEVRFNPDSKAMWLKVDNGKEDFIMCDIMEESDNQHGLKPDVLSEQEKREYTEMDEEKRYENEKWAKHFAKKYGVDFDKQEYIFTTETDEVPLPVNNVLCGCSIRLNVGEGILDFLYADFETPYKENYFSSYMTEVLLPEAAKDDSKEVQELLDKMKAEQKSTINVNKVLSEADLIYEDYLRYCSTVFYAKNISYASLYSAICPPVFSEHYEHTAYKLYYRYLKMLQEEFLELIEFCFDDEFYPEIFSECTPYERFYIYSCLADRPIHFCRNETFLTTAKSSYGMFLKEGLSEKQIIKQLTSKIKTTPGIIELSKKYDIEQEELKALIKIPKFVDKYYDFSTVSDILELEFTKMLEMDIRFRKCKRCGKYFIVKGNHGTKYCDRVEEGKTQSCQKLAALDNYKKKNADNAAKKIYDKYYKRYSARLKVRQIKETDFNRWRYQAITMRDDCSNGKISVEDYVSWNERAFPNRVKKS